MGPRGKAPGPPREFFIRCWKCHARIYFETERSRPPVGQTDLSCAICGAIFIIKPSRKKAQAQDA